MNWRKKLKIIVEDNHTREGRWFDLSIQALIILSLISFSIETLPDLNKNLREFLKIFEVITVLIFTIEYLLRLYVSDKKFNLILCCS